MAVRICTIQLQSVPTVEKTKPSRERYYSTAPRHHSQKGWSASDKVYVGITMLLRLLLGAKVLSIGATLFWFFGE